jgi:S1-C subfamily serine protease
VSTDDDDGGEIGRVPPPEPDDRLWRHPSEVSSFGRARLPGVDPVPVPAPASTVEVRGPLWPLALVAAFVGAVLCGGVLALTGNLSVDRGAAVEKVNVSPIVPSPLLVDESTVDALRERVGPAVVRVELTTGDDTTSACGVIVRGDGVIVVSAHDVADATAITVVLHDGRSVEGELVGYDLPTDVGVVRIEADGLTVAVLGKAADLEPGRAVLALGLTSDRELAVSTGVVSALNQRVDSVGETLHGLIQTDAPVERAWSGGALVDDTGAVVGITHAVDGEDGFGFATPIELVHRLAGELLANGRITHGWLGIVATDITESEAADREIRGGAEIREVLPGSPAADAGLTVGDVITTIAGDRVDSSTDLVVLLRTHKPGDVIDVDYLRGTRHRQVEVTIEPDPDG